MPPSVALAVLRLAIVLCATLPLLGADPAAAAREVMARFTPAALDAHIAAHPDEIPAIFVGFGDALMSDDAALRRDLQQYLARFTREHAKRERDVRVVVSLQLVDPNRFLGDHAFRARVLPMLRHALDAATPFETRLAALRELNGPIGLTFAEAESVAVAWGVVPRSSADRRIAFGGEVRMPDDLSGPIEASIYSLGSQFFTPEEAKTFVDAVQKAAPKRRLIVLADAPMAAALGDVTRVETFSRPFTPWPRDPFIVARHRSGDVAFVNRPNLQPEREEDANMVRALVGAAPLSSMWSVAPVPFHNGHVLLTPDAAWISIHTVEIRALQLLKIDRVPVASFGTPHGIQRYLTAVRIAAREYEGLYRRPVKFVHPLDPDPELFRRLGGGGGFDLDSLVTMLPQPDRSLVALVGDPSLGAKLKVPAVYGSKGKLLPATELAAFLDTVAASLTKQGVKVQRIPLMLVDHQPEPFLINWNNVVLEAHGEVRRAEGFASLIDEADKQMKDVFAAAGYELTLFPPLVRSVVLNGGYRCASNHIRP